MPVNEQYMFRCIELARLALGKVSPNPMVGAVIVCDDRIIGEDYHQQFGGAHAEVNAINEVLNKFPDAIELLKRSTLYVSLEPCSHFGKTPPCADLIIKYSIPKVVIGCRDPFEHVNGKGIEKMRNAGIDITEDICREDCLELNKRFFTRVEKQRPYIILKWAQTANGYFAPANGTKKWISSDLSKRLVHKWRAEEDAVLVGKNTAAIDNPQLNVRLWEGRNPVRIVIDRKLELSQKLYLFDNTQETIVFNELKTEINGAIKYLQLDDFENSLPQLICYQLYLMDFQSVLIEGGAKTLDLFIKVGLWDEARIFTSGQNWAEGIIAPGITGKRVWQESIGPDNLEIRSNIL